MAQVTPLLIELGAYDGLVALAVAKAKALDPEQVATQQSDAGADARAVCCYPHCCCHCVAFLVFIARRDCVVQ